MKISQLVIVIILAGLGVMGIKYTLDQSKTMELLIAAHGGGPLVEDADATGLRKEKAALTLEVSTAATERAEAVKASESARIEMTDMRNKRDDAKAQLASDTAEHEEWVAKAKPAEKKLDQLKAEYEKAAADLKNIPELRGGTEIGAIMDNLREIVAEAKENQQKLTEDLEAKKQVTAEATKKVAAETVEFERVKAINDRFFTNYNRNKDEFPILAVDTRWNFVVFTAGKDSGLVAGDTTPVLVKRNGTLLAKLRIVSVTAGQVIAEYDPAQLPAGVRIETGDLAFREKPLGS